MPQLNSERVVGSFEGEKPGPLIIVMAALHGNEHAGVSALEMVFYALEQERRDNPGFQFQGKLLGLIGNLQAFKTRQRYLDVDLNRVWTDDFISKIGASNPKNLETESRELRSLFDCISAEYQSTVYKPVVMLDLHTTSAEGGVFSIPTDEEESLRLAQHLGAPAIVGLQASISGTLLGFAAQHGFSPESPLASILKLPEENSAQKSMSSNPICVAFEAGQHESPYSVTRSAIAILRCLRVLNAIPKDYLMDLEGSLSLPFIAFAPPVVRFQYAHPIGAEDEFRMRPGYVNFQPVQQGEHLADDVHGPVLSPHNGLILMPLYQAKGTEGFFIVR
ncbi:MAG: succinylglutamate desuccinylase/aspartoacylase family protein [Saprospiraceae bacterium]